MRRKICFCFFTTILAITGCSGVSSLDESAVFIGTTRAEGNASSVTVDNSEIATTSENTSATDNVIISSDVSSSEMQYTTEAGDITIESSGENESIETTIEQAATPVSITATVSGKHYIGETLDAADFIITVNMSDGTQQVNPAGWAANILKLESESTEIVVAYGDLYTTITVAAEVAVTTTATPVSNELKDQIAAAAAVDKNYWGPLIDSKTIYLTIDDGPSVNTTVLLDMLDQYGIKATWFVCYNPTYESMYAEIVRRGHSIAIHSKTHKYDLIYSSFENWYEDYIFMYNYIVQLTGVAPVAYRFPGGSVSSHTGNHPEVKLKILQYLNETGMPYFDWNVTNGDSAYPSFDEAVANGMTGVNRKHPVFLCHDARAMQITVDTLPTIISQYLALGYKFDKITSSTAPIHQGTAWDY